MNETQAPGHTFGPPAPSIAFYYGERYLGEARGGLLDVERVRTKLLNQLYILYPGLEGAARRAMLSYGCVAKLYCGPNVFSLSELRQNLSY